MFGIGLPEMILILALALIVVGPDKLPGLARSVAKGMMELKKTAEALKKNLTEDGNPLDALKSEINSSSRALQDNLLESPDQSWKTRTPGEGVNPAPAAPGDTIIEAELTTIDETQATPAEEQIQETSKDTTTQLPPTQQTTPETAQEKNNPPVC
jgi:sec-independent protein translocase protein TatB